MHTLQRYYRLFNNGVQVYENMATRFLSVFCCGAHCGKISIEFIF